MATTYYQNTTTGALMTSTPDTSVTGGVPAGYAAITLSDYNTAKAAQDATRTANDNAATVAETALNKMKFSSQDNFGPADHGLVAWSQDPATLPDFFSLATGVVYLTKVKVTKAATVSNILYGVFTAGTGLTAAQNLVGLYDATGARLAVSADQTTAMGSTGLKTAAITPVALATGYYYVAFLANGSGVPSVVAGGIGTVPVLNVGLTASASRALATAAGNTALPATITLGSQTPNSAARWGALS